MTPIARRRLRRAVHSEIMIDVLVGSMILCLVALIVMVVNQLW